MQRSCLVTAVVCVVLKSAVLRMPPGKVCRIPFEWTVVMQSVFYQVMESVPLMATSKVAASFVCIVTIKTRRLDSLKEIAGVAGTVSIPWSPDASVGGREKTAESPVETKFSLAGSDI